MWPRSIVKCYHCAFLGWKMHIKQLFFFCIWQTSPFIPGSSLYSSVTDIRSTLIGQYKNLFTYDGFAYDVKPNAALNWHKKKKIICFSWSDELDNFFLKSCSTIITWCKFSLLQWARNRRMYSQQLTVYDHWSFSQLLGTFFRSPLHIKCWKLFPTVQ